MNKKLRRLMQPNLALFFVVMALFCAAAVALPTRPSGVRPFLR